MMAAINNTMAKSKSTIDVLRNITLREQGQEFLTNKSILAYLGGVSKDFIKDLRESGQLHYYKVNNTIFYKVADVRRLIEKNKIV